MFWRISLGTHHPFKRSATSGDLRGCLCTNGSVCIMSRLTLSMSESYFVHPSVPGWGTHISWTLGRLCSSRKVRIGFSIQKRLFGIANASCVITSLDRLSSSDGGRFLVYLLEQ